MTITRQIADIAPLLDLDDYAGEFLADYDMDAIRADYLDQIQAALPPGVTLTASGVVYADLDVADEARDLNWGDIVDGIDPVLTFQRHDITTRIREVPSATGIGSIFEGYGHDGQLVAAWGPDTLDGDSNTVEARDDSWSATQWIDDEPRQTINGSRADIETAVRRWLINA